MVDTTRYVEGGRELAKRLLRMGPEIRAKVLGKAVRSGTQVVKDEAITQAPYYHGSVQKGHPPPGTLKRSIVMKYIREQSDAQQVTYYVVPRSGHGKRQRGTIFHVGLGETVTYDYSVDAYYWKFVEFGTAKMSPRAFMRGAFVAKRDAALTSIMNVLRDGVQKVAQDLGRQT